VASVLRVQAPAAGPSAVAASGFPFGNLGVDEVSLPSDAKRARGTDPVRGAREEAQHDEYRSLLQQRTTALGQLKQDPNGPSLTSPETGPGMPSKHGLIRLLSADDTPQVRAAAAFQLGAQSGDDVSRSLATALDDRSEIVALQAIASLVQIGDPSVVPQLSALLQRRRDPNVQAAVAQAVDDLESGRPSTARASGGNMLSEQRQ
jgi:hypothetical protein